MDTGFALPSLQVLFEESIHRFPDLSFTLGVCNLLGACLSIAKKDLHGHQALLSRVKIVVKEDGGYDRRVESAIVLLIVLQIFTFSHGQVSA